MTALTIDAPRSWAWRMPVLRTEWLLVLLSLYFAVFCNLAFWRGVSTALPSHSWLLDFSLFLLLFAVNALLLGVLVNDWIAKPLLTIIILVTAGAGYYMSAYNVYLDTDMLRNVLKTDPKESRELLSFGLIKSVLLYATPPLILLFTVKRKCVSWRSAVLGRSLFLLAVTLLGLGGAMLSFQNVSSLMRNHKELRYLVTPANYLVGLVRIVVPAGSSTNRSTTLLPVAVDAQQQLPVSLSRKPRLLVMVVGETARAQNWGLNGYARQTTPQLSQLGVYNFSDMSACGTSTEVSLPCMFSPWGRRNYDREKIVTHESALHVLARAGVATLWRDNQSGCKGVCTGLPTESFYEAKDPAYCNERRCFDEVMLAGLPALLDKISGDRIVVLHQLGNHGPSYFERYPAALRRFTPTCDNAELGQCSREQIVNAYDNAILYTDDFLSKTIRMLQKETAYDTALLYVSDHGESLGEKGLYLHGVPYAIAPAEQTRVPMIMWFSPDFLRNEQIDTTCLQRVTKTTVSHDNLFSTLLGVFQVRTKAYEPAMDILATCRGREMQMAAAE